MTKANPTVQEYMTKAPFTIGVDQTLAHAREMMRAHNIRHLPVLSGGRLEGVLSDRDIAVVETLRDVDPAKVTVEEAMTPVVYTVAPSEALAAVAEHMAEHKYGSALVVEHSKVVGVFTAVDALHALAVVLKGR